jgi:hypothetical protein
MDLIITYSNWKVVRSHYKALGLNQANIKWKEVTRLLALPPSSRNSTTGKLEHSVNFNHTIRYCWG